MHWQPSWQLQSQNCDFCCCNCCIYSLHAHITSYFAISTFYSHDKENLWIVHTLQCASWVLWFHDAQTGSECPLAGRDLGGQKVHPWFKQATWCWCNKDVINCITAEKQRLLPVFGHRRPQWCLQRGRLWLWRKSSTSRREVPNHWSPQTDAVGRNSQSAGTYILAKIFSESCLN